MEEWKTVEHALSYLERADQIPHRTEGEGVLLEEIPKGVKRILDLGSGDGRLIGLALAKAASATGTAIDFSPPMLDRLRERFADSRERIMVIEHNLESPLPENIGTFDRVISSFAIHHLIHERKRALYREIFEILEPDGVFCNLEHVSSPTEELHHEFLRIIGTDPKEEDPSNRLLDVKTQLVWLREIGFKNVDCYWKWRELALLVGRKP